MSTVVLKKMTDRQSDPAVPPHRSKGRPRSFDRAAALEQALRVFWRHGFAPTSIAELCTAMGINPPSLYAAFGSKAQLFMEAVEHYERIYWDATWDRMVEEPDVTRAVKDFFRDAASMLTSQDAPCGCVVALGAINVPADASGVADALRALRDEGRRCFLDRLRRGVEAGQLPPGTNVEAIANTLNTLLQGMSIEASDGATRAQLQEIAACAVTLLPSR